MKELYCDNAELMQCLQLSEQRSVDAETRVLSLDERCFLLKKLLATLGDSVAQL